MLAVVTKEQPSLAPRLVAGDEGNGHQGQPGDEIHQGTLTLVSSHDVSFNAAATLKSPTPAAGGSKTADQ